ncbi:MAG: 4-(cytidine 5'-diphospho)-2-C-methyl-D-erythritol kinase [Clostridia bacterium]|nr:4-(cytidine 5'-diphospho)-2-C-methyl-D-erythritol kinase [Clostridia bacterium]
MTLLKNAVPFRGAAYAKINLYLNVESRRNDGFHNIVSVMQSVSLADEVYGEIRPSSARAIRLRMENSDIPADEKNLAFRAADAFLSAANLTAEVDLTVVKRIPAAAGLAGGSADAAAVLRLLNQATGEPIPQKQLLELAATLGSDVPFCLVGGTRLCRGRGERMEMLPTPALHCVIAMPNAAVSTPAAYRRLDALYSNFDGSVKNPCEGGERALVNALKQGGEALAKCVFNLFEEAVLPDCPDAVRLLNEMRTAGALAAMMSGSGPSVFGIFESREAAELAAKKIGGAVVFSTPSYESKK